MQAGEVAGRRVCKNRVMHVEVPFIFPFPFYFFFNALFCLRYMKIYAEGPPSRQREL